MACYHHPSQEAVARCSECQKSICKDCYDIYSVGIGAGKTLCFNCAEKTVKEHAADVAAFRKQVDNERTWMVVGAIFGYAVGGMGSGSPIVSVCVFTAFIGASLGTIINTVKRVNSRDGDDAAWVAAIGLIIISPIITIYRFVKRFYQIKQAREVIANDEHILQEMRVYFEYSQIIDRNRGVDLAKLASQGGELFDNTYAQTTLRQGENVAFSSLRHHIAQIAVNGEIIRSFGK